MLVDVDIIMRVLLKIHISYVYKYGENEKTQGSRASLVGILSFILFLS